MLTVRPLTFGTRRGLTPAGSVLLPYGGSFSKGASVVICADAAADPSTGSGRSAIATPPSAEAPARNRRLGSSNAGRVIVPPCVPIAGRPQSSAIAFARDPRSCKYRDPYESILSPCDDPPTGA